jgi:hypothetical protein
MYIILVLGVCGFGVVVEGVRSELWLCRSDNRGIEG